MRIFRLSISIPLILFAASLFTSRSAKAEGDPHKAKHIKTRSRCRSPLARVTFGQALGQAPIRINPKAVTYLFILNLGARTTADTPYFPLGCLEFLYRCAGLSAANRRYRIRLASSPESARYKTGCKCSRFGTCSAVDVALGDCQRRYSLGQQRGWFRRIDAPASNQTEQPATQAINVAPESQPSNTGGTTTAARCGTERGRGSWRSSGPSARSITAPAGGRISIRNLFNLKHRAAAAALPNTFGVQITAPSKLAISILITMRDVARESCASQLTGPEFLQHCRAMLRC